MPRGKNPNSLKNLEKRKPFVKGDPRIKPNPGGRVKSFDDLRALFQEIANEIDPKTKKKRIEKIGETLASDKRLMKEFLEFGYGKVPLSQIVDITSGGKPLNWMNFINNDSDDGSTEEDKSEETG